MPVNLPVSWIKFPKRIFFDKGAALGKGRGRLFIQPGVKFSQKMKDSFSDDTPDHRILAVTEYISEKMKGQKVILVTKDMNLRMKAVRWDVQAEDYKRIRWRIWILQSTVVSGNRRIDTEVINRIYENANGVEVEQVFPKQELKGNNYYVLKNGNASVLACYDPVRRVIRKVEKPNVFGIYPKNAEQAFAVDALLNPNIQLVAIRERQVPEKLYWHWLRLYSRINSMNLFISPSDRRFIE